MQKIIIGSDPSCDYVVNSTAVSKTHGKIYLTDKWVVTSYFDQSDDGSKVNGDFVHQAAHPLKTQDIITLPGDIELKVSDIVASVHPDSATSQVVPPQTVIVESPVPENTSVASNVVPASTPESTSHVSSAPKDISLFQALVLFFQNYVNFSGRSRRKEFWYIVPFNFIFSLIPVVKFIWYIATIIPSLSVIIRRLHDTGKSGWYCLFNLIPFVGQIIIIVFMCQDSQPGPNKWGPCPK